MLLSAIRHVPGHQRRDQARLDSQLYLSACPPHPRHRCVNGSEEQAKIDSLLM